MKKACTTMVLLVSTLLLMQRGFAQATDYKFHTVFIYNFTKYVKWPDEAVQGNFVIGVVGKSDITNALKEMAANKTVNGKPIEIKTFNSTEEIKDCQIVFVPFDRSKDISAVRNKLSTQPILIISEKAGLAQQGSDINFIMHDGRWKFEVNQATTEQHKLKISHELIKFALKVYTEV